MQKSNGPFGLKLSSIEYCTHWKQRLHFKPKHWPRCEPTAPCWIMLHQGTRYCSLGMLCYVGFHALSRALLFFEPMSHLTGLVKWNLKLNKVYRNPLMSIFDTLNIWCVRSVYIASLLTFDKCFVPFQARTTMAKNKSIFLCVQFVCPSYQSCKV